jgi:hypothetical protein
LHFEIALEQPQGCVQATTETAWHVMLVLLQSRELLRKDPEKHDYSVYQILEGDWVVVNGANAIVVGLSRGDFIGAGLGESMQLICARRAPIQEQKWSSDCCH